jgi:hypothetical protein
MYRVFTIHNEIVQATSRGHIKSTNVCDIGRGEAQHKNYKLKLCGAEAYGRSSHLAAVVT